jgi:hypothetical protein
MSAEVMASNFEKAVKGGTKIKVSRKHENSLSYLSEDLT